MRADLHVHSNASDGTDPPAEVIRRAAQAGLDAVALTDHDTTAGHDPARRAVPGSLSLVPGMELSCQLDGRSLHLLAYLFDPDDPRLAAETRRIRDDRVLRAHAMVDRLADLGVAITWDDVTAIAGSAVVGRPHIARAMVASGPSRRPRRRSPRTGSPMAAARTSPGTRWIRSGPSAWFARRAVSAFSPTRARTAICSWPTTRSPPWPPRG